MMFCARYTQRFAPLFAILALLPGCSGPDVLNALVPEDGYTLVADQAYGEGPRRTLDLYVPEAAPGAAAPTVIFFYGGGWESGAKEDYRFVGEAFASRGYLTVIPDYRLYPDVRFPAFLEDAAAAVAWVRDRSHTEAGSVPDAAPGPIYLVGHSAGAYIAVMLTLDPHWLVRAGVAICDTIAATAGLAGPYDFLPLESATLESIFGADPTPPETQPITHVRDNAPPILLITGADDMVVEPRNSHNLTARLRDASGSVEEIVYDDVGHIALVAALASPLRGVAPTLGDVVNFLRQHPQVAGC